MRTAQSSSTYPTLVQITRLMGVLLSTACGLPSWLGQWMAPQLAFAAGQDTQGAEASHSGKSTDADELATDDAGLSRVAVAIETSHGTIEFKFYPKDAPKTSQRILELVKKGFYDGLTFHRVVSGFVVQGGDPSGNGTGGSGQKLNAEFNQRKHLEGTLAMARSSNPHSADSQFYICLGAQPSLDNQYTVFGQVTKGLDLVKKIRQGDKMTKVHVISTK